MAHFAKIGMNSKVLTVLVLNDKDMLNADGVEDESVGQDYLELHNNWPAQMWIQTSYNTCECVHSKEGTPFRGNYAGIGYVWDKDNDMFYPPKDYPSWVLNLDTATWHSPIGDAPNLTDEQKNDVDEDGNKMNRYDWNEKDGTWDLVTVSRSKQITTP